MPRRTVLAVAALALAASACAGGTARPAASPEPEIISVLQPGRSPLVSFRILFNTGSALDPADKEGLASLTAAMLAQGGTEEMPYRQIVEAMYPMATSFGWQVDKEMTVFTGTTHVENLERYYGLIRAMLLEPGFREEDFTRLRTNAINFLRVTLREGNDEELGKERLYNVIYAGHPYEHHSMGRIEALESLTLEDVRDFYRQHYTQGNLVVGLAGGYPAGFAQRVQNDFRVLPLGPADRIRAPAPELAPGMEIEIIQRDTRSTAISLGFPIDVIRPHPDWPALAVVASYLGQHRSSNSYLYQRLREARGLNYGDYAYIEYFPRGMFQFTPDPNLARQQQIFQIWIRPVEPEHGHFTLRAALYEYDKLLREGMSREAFEATREFLTKYTGVLTQTQDLQLGYALDSRHYGIGNFNQWMQEQLAALTLEEVNRALREHLRSDRMRVVMVTGDAEALREAIVSNRPSPITYNSPKPQEILEEDRVIQDYRIEVQPERVRVVPVAEVFR
ncbi:MAG: insulinase family protein [Gemmatimonadetes bacterium]|nr:insulinase family protein [Gemmatimonadota bacterium]